MKQDHVKIGIILSDLEVLQRAQRLALLQNIYLLADVGSLESAIPVARVQVRQGADVIISRHGTGQMIKEILGKEYSETPLVQVEPNSYEILDALRLALNRYDRVAFASYKSMPKGFDVIEKILNKAIRPLIYTSTMDLEEKIYQFKKENIQALIGGELVRSLSEHIGLPCVKIVISDDVILDAFSKGRLISEVRQQNIFEMQRLETIVSNIKEAIIAIDSSGNITLFNNHAEEILGISRDSVIGKEVGGVLPYLGLQDILNESEPEVDQIQNFGFTIAVVNRIPIIHENKIIGAMITFRDLPKILNTEKRVRETIALGFKPKYDVKQVIASSNSMKSLLAEASLIAASDCPTLIIGESGVGKEVIAHIIHSLSPRNGMPFVPFNCSSIPEALVESELFGYEGGAFTGALRRGKVGLFELAQGGTIFLDEVADLPINLQAKCLRTLQEKEVMRIGSNRLIAINVRVLASTNRDIVEEINNRRFRRDLYFRLSTTIIQIDPLRERKEDISDLALFFLSVSAQKYGRKEAFLTKDMLMRLESYHWPGNVRELQNFIERYVLMLGKNLKPEVIFDDILEEFNAIGNRLINSNDMPLTSTKKALVNKILRETNYNISETARRLAVSRTTLWRWKKQELM